MKRKKTLDFDTWRDLLGNVIQNIRERERIARTLNISSEALLGWANGEIDPPLHLLQSLPATIPRHSRLMRTLIAEEFDDFSSISPAISLESIPVSLYAHILDLSQATPTESRFWSISSALLSEALKQLDPERLGCSISVIRCIAPVQGDYVHGLRECIGQGTPPWQELVEFRQRFLGVESLAGRAVASGMPQISADLSAEQHLSEQTLSAAAFPILYADRIAGSLLVASTQVDYFSAPARQNLIQSYTSLFMLALQPEDFYAKEQIALQVMPSLLVQQPYLAALRERILATLRTAFHAHHPMSYHKAEQYIWGVVAEELLKTQSH